MSITSISVKPRYDSERLRLMGLSDREVKILEDTGISDTQLNKLAGNSIVVDVLEAVFRQLFGKSKSESLGKVSDNDRTVDEWREEVRDKARNPELVIVKLVYASKNKARSEFVLVDRTNADREVFLTRLAYDEYRKAGVKDYENPLLDEINKWTESNKKLLSTMHSETEMGWMSRKNALLMHKEERLSAIRFRIIEDLHNGNKSDFRKTRAFRLLDFSNFDKLLKSLELEFSVLMLRDYISRLRYANARPSTIKKQVRL